MLRLQAHPRRHNRGEKEMKRWCEHISWDMFSKKWYYDTKWGWTVIVGKPYVNDEETECFVCAAPRPKEKRTGK